MSDPTVSERRIRPIQDAVASANWKQALQLCDKWSKKGEKSDRFLALKAFVQVNQPDASIQDRGKAETVQLCRRDPAVTDLDALHQIQDTLKNLSLHTEEGPKLWDRAVASKPNDKDLLLTWLNRSISEGNWLSAQKATMALRKAFPKERDYEFWNILMCYLIHRDGSIPEKNRGLFGTLAYRMVSKAAEAVPTDKGQLLSAGKAVQKPEELFLLARIYLELGHAEEAVQILQSDHLGVRSRFAELDPQLVQTLLFEAFEAAQLWEKAFEFCIQLLSDEDGKELSAVEDETVWRVCLKAVQSSRQEKQQEQLQELMRERLKDSSPRSLFQAELRLMRQNASDKCSQSALLRSCQTYYEHFCSKPYCLEDLKDPINTLEPDLKKEFFEGIMSQTTKDESKSSLLESLIGLKMHYYFASDWPRGKSSQWDAPSEALQLYEFSIKSSYALPEACFMAALAITRSGHKRNGNGAEVYSNLTTAAVLLSACCKHAEHYYPAMLLLIRIQLLLGCISSAMMNFKKLNVKNIQWETMGHLLLTRMSTLHPQQYGKITPSKENGFNPLEAVDLTLTVFENAERSLSQQIYRGLQSGSYANVVKSVQMRSDMQNSINLHLCTVEERRIRRLRGIAEEGSLLVRPESLVDNRNISDFADFERSDDSKPDHLRCGPAPNGAWLDSMALFDYTFGLLKAEIQPQSGSPNLDQIKGAISRVKDFDKSTSAFELTETEISNLDCHLLIAETTISVRDGAPVDQKILDANFSKIQQWLESQIQRSKTPKLGIVDFPDWQYLHSAFSCLETLHLVSVFITAMSKKPKTTKSKTTAHAIPTERLTSLRQWVTKVEISIHKDAKRVKDCFNESGVLGRLMDVALGRKEDGDDSANDEGDGILGAAIERICDAATLETFCGEMRESWEEALDGILAVKIKIYK